MSGFARRLQQGAGQPQAVAGNVLAQDDFNRADGSLGTADIGGAWTTHIGTLTGTPAWTITSDTVAATGPGSTDNWLSATLPLSVATGSIFCDFYLSPTSANTGVCLWSSTDGTTYLNVQLNESDTYDRIAISKRVAGSTTWLQEQDGLNFGNGVGYSLAVVFTATTVMVYLDGVRYIDYDFTAQDLTDLAGGTFLGLRSWYGPGDDDGGSRWDRFLVTDSTSIPASRVPAAPWQVTATSAGNGQADIAWANGGNGGSPLTGFIITSSDGPSFTLNDPNVATFHATGLSNLAQTFTVQAVNTDGSSDAAAPCAQSNSVTPAVATAPSTPTNVTATAGDTQAIVSWQAPADGGAPITDYTVTTNPGGGTTTSSSTSATISGLTNGSSYTFTVTATNSVGTSPASSPSNSITPTAPGSVLYGPDGTETPPTTTPSYTGSWDITATPSTFLSVIAGLTTAQANSGTYRVGLQDGDYAASAKLIIPANPALTSATANVLIAAINPGQAKFTKGLEFDCSHITLGYVEIDGNTYFRSCNGTWLWRTYHPGGANFNAGGTGGGGSGVCGAVAPDIYEDNTSGNVAYDRIHIGGAATGVCPTNFSFIRCWIEGEHELNAANTGHSDHVQIDGLNGTFLRQNCYMGPAMRGGSPQAKADIFDYTANSQFCTFQDDTCWLMGSFQNAQGNASNQSGPHRSSNTTYVNISGGSAFKVYSPLVATGSNPTTPDIVLTNCTFYGSAPSGTGVTVTNPTIFSKPANAVSGSMSGWPVPVYAPPPWQWW